MTRDKFCSTLDRFWTRFARSWDVLLHGNPAADLFGGIKLASGGELGFGVGEEEWGSGEREVLEDLARRTEGLVDLVVARFGEPVPAEERKASEDDEEAMPWMGGGHEPVASDGVIFGGIGRIQRRSLRDVSLWMRQIYTYGDQAYGVKDNVLRERRKRRRREPPESTKPANGQVTTSSEAKRGERGKGTGAEDNTAASRENAVTASSDKPAQVDPDVASQDQATSKETPASPDADLRPSIPPPIVASSEQAVRKSASDPDKDTEQQDIQGDEATDEAGTTLGIPDQYMKYLTFGLSTLGKQKRPSTPRRTSAASTITPQTQSKDTGSRKAKPKSSIAEEEGHDQSMTHVEPIPDGEVLRSRLATQKKQENRGHFVIGLKGNLLELDELSEDDDQTDMSEEDDGVKSDGSRIVLRTVQVEVVPRDDTAESENDNQVLTPNNEDPPGNNYRRVRVALYVHRPFMYCFLFADRTGSLQYTGFYKNLHRNLVPIHKPLLSSTSVEKVRQRIENSHISPSIEDDSSDVRSQKSGTNRLPSRTATSNTYPIYDLIYDPQRLTLHTSIPNIPEPGTPAAEGIFTGILKAGADSAIMPSWTRIEALNVHSQILNTLASVKHRRYELERTSKTNRGWWVVWMKVPPSGALASTGESKAASTAAEATSSVQTLHSTNTEARNAVQGKDEGDMHRIAFLVRKATDAPPPPKTASTGSKAVSSMLEVMSLGMAGRDDESSVGAGDGWGPAALAGGIGIDARKYVEGLLSLNR